MLSKKIIWPYIAIVLLGFSQHSICKEGTAIECIALIGHTAPVVSAVFSADNSQVLTASYDGTARLWKARTGNCLHVLQGHADAVCSAEFRIPPASRWIDECDPLKGGC